MTVAFRTRIRQPTISEWGAPEPTIAVIDCEACEGTGHWWRHGVAEDGADYAVGTNLPCDVCHGAGFLEYKPEQLDCDEAFEP